MKRTSDKKKKTYPATKAVNSVVCEVRRTDKCSFISICIIILKLQVHIASMFSL